MNPPDDQQSEAPTQSDLLHGCEDLWTTKEVAKFLQISSKTVFELRKKGLPYVKLGGSVRFVPSEVRQYLVNSRHLSSHRLRQIARKGLSA